MSISECHTVKQNGFEVYIDAISISCYIRLDITFVYFPYLQIVLTLQKTSP